MTTIDPRPATPADAVDAAHALLSTITGRTAEIEANRRLPKDLLDALIAAGSFRVLLPPSHGGLGADLPTAMRLYETLARADASVAWTVMIGSAAWCDLAALPRATFDELFTPGRDVIVAGAFSPSGSIAVTADGYRVNGRWSFASGCEHATWLYGNCVEDVVDGVPRLRIAVFSPDDVIIEDTWHVSGLCGTGSHHFRVEDRSVVAERTFALMHDEPCLDEPIARIPVPTLAPLTIASVAIGIARSALDDITALAVSKVPLLDPAPLAKNPHFHVDLATADTELRAARALLYETAASAWATAIAADAFTLDQRAHVRAAAVWATERAAAAVDTAYRSGGGSSIYLDSPLQRRFRDIHTLTQHFLVKRDTLTTAGAILAGNDVDVMVF